MFSEPLWGIEPNTLNFFAGMAIMAIVIVIVALAVRALTPTQKKQRVIMQAVRPNAHRSAHATNFGTKEENIAQTNVGEKTFKVGPVEVTVTHEEESTESETVEEDEDDDEDPSPDFAARIKERRTAGDSPANALAACMKDMDDDQLETFLGFLSEDETAYTIQDIAAALALVGNDVGTVAELLNKKHSPSAEEWIVSLFPLSQEESLKNKAKKVLSSVLDALGDDWGDDAYSNLDPDDCVNPLVTAGCALEDVVVLLYEMTNKRLGTIIDDLPAEKKPDMATVAKWITACGIDLSDDADEYERLRDKVATLEEIALVFKHLNVPADKAIETVGTDENWSEDTDDIIKAFLGAGYPTMLVLSAMTDDWNDAPWSDTLSVMQNAGVTRSDIVTMLRSINADADDLDQSLRESGDWDLKDRVEILYGLLFQDAKSGATEESTDVADEDAGEDEEDGGTLQPASVVIAVASNPVP